MHIGDTHRAAGRPAEAALIWRHALEILEDLGYPDTDQVLERMILADAR